MATVQSVASRATVIRLHNLPDLDIHFSDLYLVAMLTESGCIPNRRLPVPQVQPIYGKLGPQAPAADRVVYRGKKYFQGIARTDPIAHAPTVMQRLQTLL